MRSNPDADGSPKRSSLITIYLLSIATFRKQVIEFRITDLFDLGSGKICTIDVHRSTAKDRRDDKRLCFHFVIALDCFMQFRRKIEILRKTLEAGLLVHLILIRVPRSFLLVLLEGSPCLRAVTDCIALMDRHDVESIRTVLHSDHAIDSDSLTAVLFECTLELDPGVTSLHVLELVALVHYIRFDRSDFA